MVGAAYCRSRISDFTSVICVSSWPVIVLRISVIGVYSWFDLHIIYLYILFKSMFIHQTI